MLQIVVLHVNLWFCAIFCILLSGKLIFVFVEMRVSFNLQAEQETDEVYAQITLHPEADVRNTFLVLFIVLCQLALFDY